LGVGAAAAGSDSDGSKGTSPLMADDDADDGDEAEARIECFFELVERCRCLRSLPEEGTSSAAVAVEESLSRWRCLRSLHSLRSFLDAELLCLDSEAVSEAAASASAVAVAILLFFSRVLPPLLVRSFLSLLRSFLSFDRSFLGVESDSHSANVVDGVGSVSEVVATSGVDADDDAATAASSSRPANDLSFLASSPPNSHAPLANWLVLRRRDRNAEDFGLGVLLLLLLLLGVAARSASDDEVREASWPADSSRFRADDEIFMDIGRRDDMVVSTKATKCWMQCDERKACNGMNKMRCAMLF
jgi:hypothetical protein